MTVISTRHRGSPVPGRLSAWLIGALLGSLLVAGNAAAGEPPGAGFSLGAGFTAHAPAPGPAFRVHLPAFELALGLPCERRQLRLRTPLLETVYNAILRYQLYLEFDAMLLFFPGAEQPEGTAGVRPVVGPLAGFRINAAPGAVQPGLVLGGRIGGELRGKGRRSGLFFGAEPLLELIGGSAGEAREVFIVGGGAFFTIAVTGYRKP